MPKINFDDIKNLIKEYKKDVNYWILIIIIATLFFGLGYLTNREFSHAQIIIEKCSDLTNKQ